MAFNKESFEHFWQHLDILFGRKVDKIAGKGLSSNDFTNEDKEKLASLKECVQPDWNVNNENDPAYVKNRTHCNIDHSIVWDGNADELTPVKIYADVEYYKMSDYVPSTRQELIGQIYTITEDGSSYPFTITSESFNEIAFLFDIYLIDSQIAIVTKDDALSQAGLKLAKGIYFAKPLRNNIFISSLSLPIEIKQLDEKYIPDTIARVSDIPDSLTIDLTDTEQGTAAGINADTLGGVVASDYVLHDELNTEVNNVITELNTLKTDISDNYVLKNDIDKLSNSAQIDLEGVGNTGEIVLTNADLLAGMTYQQIMDKVYPIGRVIMTFESEDPNVLYSWQTWERTANGRFLLGANDSYALGSEGGEAEHTLTVDEMPEHVHTGGFNDISVSSGSYSYARPVDYAYSSEYKLTLPTGGSQPHNNMPPYLAVNMWKRTA